MRSGGNFLEPCNVECAYGPGEALQLEVAHKLGLYQAFNRSVDPLTNEDLSGSRVVAQSAREIRDGADGPVVPTPLEANFTDRGVSESDPDPEAQLMTTFRPRPTEFRRSDHNALATWSIRLNQL